MIGVLTCLCVCVCVAGLPKAAIINHEKLLAPCFMLAIAGVRSDDIIYVYLPLYHSSGFLIGLCGAIDKGDARLFLKEP